MLMNALALGFTVLLVAGGIWIADFMTTHAQEPGLRADRAAGLHARERAARSAESVRLSAVDADLHRREPGEAELARRGRRQIDDAAANERTAVVDAHRDLAAVASC